MNKSKVSRLLICFLAILAGAGFIWSICDLFSLRFSRGNVHAEYSTIRTDPIGCKALLESYGGHPNITAQRLLRPTDEIDKTEDAVLFVIGLKSPDDLACNKDYLDFAAKGGRLIVIFSPGYYGTEKKKMKKSSDGKKKNPKKKEIPVKAKKKFKRKPKIFTAKKSELRLDLFNFSRQSVKRKFTPSETYRKVQGLKELPAYTTNYFKVRGKEWSVLYRYREFPVIIERDYGRGTILLCTPIYFVSNEALRKRPNTNLLCYLIGNRHNVYFEEKHHGLFEQLNIFWLGKKFRLGLLVLNLLLLAVLFVWKSLFSITGSGCSPPETRETVNIELNHTAGLVNLLKRGIARADLLKTCMGEWLKTVKYRHIPDKKLDEIRELAEVSDKAADQVIIYNRIHNILSEVKERKK